MDPVLIWIALVAAFLWLKRDHIEVQGIIFMLKNKRLAEQLYSFSRKHLLSLNPLFDVGIIFGLIGMLYTLKLLMSGALGIFKDLFLGEPAKANISIIIPGVSIPGSPLFLPLTEGVIAIAVLAIVHEFSHAIAASLQGLKPKAVAMVLLAFIPAAGVELDDKKVSKLSPRSRLRIFSAGSFANFLTAIFFTVIGITLLYLFAAPVGIEVLRVESGTPAEGVLSNGTIITSINGVTALTFNEYFLASVGFAPQSTISFSRIASSLKPGEQVVLGTTNGTVTLTLAAFPDNPTRGRIGIISAPKMKLADVGDWLPFLLGLINWIVVLNIGVGLINLLPAPLFDGGRMAEDFLKAVLPKRNAPTAIRALLAFSLTLLVINLFPTIIKIISSVVTAIVEAALAI